VFTLSDKKKKGGGAEKRGKKEGKGSPLIFIILLIRDGERKEIRRGGENG